MSAISDKLHAAADAVVQAADTAADARQMSRDVNMRLMGVETAMSSLRAEVRGMLDGFLDTQAVRDEETKARFERLLGLLGTNGSGGGHA